MKVRQQIPPNTHQESIQSTLQIVYIAARSLARAVSERGGGLKWVESMALSHDDGVVEVACNLLGGSEGTAPAEVQVRFGHEDGVVEVECNLLGGSEGTAPAEVQVRFGHEDGVVEVACNLLGGSEGTAPAEVR